MSRLFVADPAILRQEGDKLLGESRAFGQNVNKMFTTVEKMRASSWVSPAAKALAAKIATYRDDMDAMTKIIDDYGTFCMRSSNKVNRNEQNIMDTFKNKSGEIGG